MKYLISLIFLINLAFAQQAPIAPFNYPTEVQQRYWAGNSTGFPLGTIFHLGMRNVIGPVSLRTSSSAGLGGPFDFSLSALVDLPVSLANLPTTVYAGLGPSLTAGADASSLNTQGFLGVEYRLGKNEPGGIFLELGPSLEIMPELDTSFVWTLGFNYHFGD